MSDLDQTRRFYEEALEPLGYRIVFEMEGFVAFGREGQTRFAVRSGKAANTTVRWTPICTVYEQEKEYPICHQRIRLSSGFMRTGSR